MRDRAYVGEFVKPVAYPKKLVNSVNLKVTYAKWGLIRKIVAGAAKMTDTICPYKLLTYRNKL